MYLMDYNISIAVAVGFIALAGVAVEIGVLMLVYLNQSYQECLTQARSKNNALEHIDIRLAVMQGAGLRVRPIMMTVLAIVIGLVPIMLGSGAGSEVMQRIAGPMIGGMISTVLLTLLVIPAIFYVWKVAILKTTNQSLILSGEQNDA